MANKKIYKTSIFIFTRDLRLHDNTSLMEALKKSEIVIPVFILNPQQLNDSNSYKSDNCVQFMCECLEDLNGQLEKNKSRLFLFYGEMETTIKKLLKIENVDAIFMNKDYTPFAKKRESEIKKICENHNKIFESHEDYMLTGVEEIMSGAGTPYVKFTPYFNTAKKIKVRDDTKNNYKNYISKKYKFSGEFDGKLQKFYVENENIWVNGGRTNGLKMLAKINNQKKYNETRDYPFENTTNLSAYLKFNVMSVREVYKKIKNTLGKNTKLLAQLYWRDFYMNIIYHKKVIGTNMNGYKVKWTGTNSDFNKWKNGQTGFPLVDAGMRQLNKTGYMHNRVRMLVGSFLVKVLHVDWQKGEKYFASHLVDYDPANNNGGWQWVAGTGTDSQPYFRYLNPWSQLEKYDSDAIYVKQWVEELCDVPNKDIRKWQETYVNHKDTKYPKPMYDDVTNRIKDAIKMYKH